uniref:Uncharacterized protein n=1 Tax=Candidatus Kentrum sp. LFY TaxID=2126342 RepID=A0A450UDF0_9GAMM|nr:MAG: hypothetical protein BECKLFY1418B_GA0070995_102015 [Candidatus Kentron sp. LFY]
MAGSCHENTCHATTSTTAQASLPIIPRSSLKINAQTTRGLEIQIEIQSVDCVILSDSIVVSCRPRPLAFRSLVMVFALGKAMFPNLPGLPGPPLRLRYRGDIEVDVPTLGCDRPTRNLGAKTARGILDVPIAFRPFSGRASTKRSRKFPLVPKRKRRNPFSEAVASQTHAPKLELGSERRFLVPASNNLLPHKLRSNSTLVRVRPRSAPRSGCAGSWLAVPTISEGAQFGSST